MAKRAARRLAVGLAQLVEIDVAQARIVNVRRDRRRARGWAQDTGDETRPGRVALFEIERRPSRQARALAVQFVGEILGAVIALADGVGVESVGLDDVGAGLQVGAVDALDQVRLGQVEQIEIAFEIPAVPGEARAAVIGFVEAALLDHGPHGPVQD